MSDEIYSVVCPGCNGVSIKREVIDALLEQNKKLEELLAIANGETCDCVEFKAKLNRERDKLKQELAKAKALNRIIERDFHARGEIIQSLNTRCDQALESVKMAMEALEIVSKANMPSGKLVVTAQNAFKKLKERHNL